MKEDDDYISDAEYDDLMEAIAMIHWFDGEPIADSMISNLSKE